MAAFFVCIIRLKLQRTSKQRKSRETCHELLCRDARHVGFSTLLAARLSLGILTEANTDCFGSQSWNTSVAGPKKTSGVPLHFQPNSHAQLHNMQTE